MTTITVPTVNELGLTAGIWAIDAGHSHVGFTVRHLMVSKVRGEFADFAGTITIADDVLTSSVDATVDAASVNTRDSARDEHLRTSDFFAIDQHPTWTLRSTAVRATGDRAFSLTADLTIRGVTRSVEFDLEFHGVSPDPWGGTRLGLTAQTTINRKDFGVDWNLPVDGGGVVVGEKVTITLEVEAIRQDA
jgi:polyisoprenoid-binding protein YceI